MGWLENKTALVVGGGSGIGRAVVDRFIDEGARVGVLDIATETVEALRGDHPTNCLAVQGDATSLEDNERVVAETVEAFGGLDTLICCAGVFDYFTGIVDMPKEKLGSAFDELMSTNVKSYLLATKAALPRLLEREGNIVLTVSNAAFYPDGGGPIYTASKWAVRGLVVELAYELAPKIRVNGVAPGGTPTNLRGLDSLDQSEMVLRDVPDIETLMRVTNPLQVLARPEDHAGAFTYLAAGDQSRAVTGTIIHSDGGLGVRGIAKLGGLIEDGE